MIAVFFAKLDYMSDLHLNSRNESLNWVCLKFLRLFTVLQVSSIFSLKNPPILHLFWMSIFFWKIPSLLDCFLCLSTGSQGSIFLRLFTDLQVYVSFLRLFTGLQVSNNFKDSVLVVYLLPWYWKGKNVYQLLNEFHQKTTKTKIFDKYFVASLILSFNHYKGFKSLLHALLI